MSNMVHRRRGMTKNDIIVPRMPEPPPPPDSEQPSPSANLSGSDPTRIDQGKIDSILSEACNQAVFPIKSVLNDAGILACYNIPFLNTRTGVFESDLRLFSFSSSKGAFANVESKDINVEISYPSAAFSAIPKSSSKDDSAPPQKERDETTAQKLLQTFLFVGQLDQDFTLSKLTE
jgi:hypothetical protein